jgi:SpoVK/Ycf46/Vps4 family AAA+-type ATPase
VGDLADLELLIKSRTPIVVIETHEERRVLDMLTRLVLRLNQPLFVWSITEGLKRVDLDLGAQPHNSEPTAVLRHIKSSDLDGIYVLLDFHPFLDEAVNARLLKEIAQAHFKNGHHVVLLSHSIDLPQDLHKHSAQLNLELPDKEKLTEIVKDEAFAWSSQNQQQKVKTDRKTLDMLVRNLGGLTISDARRLARKAIVDDGAITEEDLPEVMKAKYELLNQDGLLAFEYETEQFADVGGMAGLKRWLNLRKAVFQDDEAMQGLAPPKGILLLGVQGCGKSLVSKAVAGVFGVPLLRLDFGALYNKFFGESEKNLRQALKTAEVMSPCVLWIDEIEKGISTGDNDGGTSRRVLGTLLTWMAENRKSVFIVATANDIEALPPELVRKGRFDEIFFVDLPGYETRKEIFSIHLDKRKKTIEAFDLVRLAELTEGFSGAEIEQAIVSAMYVVHEKAERLSTDHIIEELERTRPLSVVMAEKIEALREWASSRTVPVE